MIKRYDIWVDYGCSTDCSLEVDEEPDGEWVKWDDVVDLFDDYDIDISGELKDFSEQQEILSVWSRGCKTELDFNTGVISVVSGDGLTRTPIYNQYTKEVLVEEDNS